ncbi:MAG: hypothetical protein LBK60_00440 [Verrucomicrobiales bacterium]|jgi:hypothetical protein|nr:hypothetical protein [Verrucomicrobiales bacterium]
MHSGNFGIIVAARDGQLTVVGDPLPLSRTRGTFLAAVRDAANDEVMLVSSVHGAVKRRKTRHLATAAGGGKKKGAKK